eukprot:CAMPEP_0118929846 /NCGR_PEP_ID=MMETSP1169-20130426/6726_1 /TAXON_ID=36882 /ORGANISM="Pyramimonas obovata, Strain CCMP722" /LENGTH=180 /DNA_ID=CAMNT_0006872107 /DNA_START=130 /DNA_END=672 /DNA_ORIENTATION=-
MVAAKEKTPKKAVKKVVKKETTPGSAKSKSKASTPTSKTTVKKETGKATTTPSEPKVKKTYELPGQKRDPPDENDSQRKFYVSLREQKPSSEMAEVWCMEHGLLSAEEAKKAFDAMNKRKNKAVAKAANNSKTPPKAKAAPKGKPTPAKKPTSASKAKKRAADEEDFQEDKPKKKAKTAK